MATTLFGVAASPTGVQVAFNPTMLFSGGIQGVWYDPSQMATMWQDSAGTTPVTAAGQPVGKILDLSGNGNHAIQATAINRPTLQQDGSGYWYLAFNGTNSDMASPSNIYDGNGITSTIGFQTASAATQQVVVSNDEKSTIRILVHEILTSVMTAIGFNQALASTSDAFGAVVNNTNSVTSAVISPALTVENFFNGASNGPTAMGGSSLFVGSYPITIGSWGGTFYFSGRLYGVLIVANALNNNNRALLERFIGNKCGVLL